MYRKSGTGYVLVVTSTTHKVSTGRKGIDGKEIELDIAYDPRKHALNYADVFTIPFSLGHTPINQKHLGSPGYGPLRRPAMSDIPSSPDIYAIGGVYSYTFRDDIAPEVEVGDRVYFRKSVLNNAGNMMGKLKGEDGKDLFIYKVLYDMIICVVRAGKIIPIGGHVLLEPIYEDWQDIYKKTYYPLSGANGERVARPQKEWIKLKAEPGADNMRGKVAHIGTPLKGEPCDIEVGETVLFKRREALSFQEIEGGQYIVVTQDQVLANLLQDVKLN